MLLIFLGAALLIYGIDGYDYYIKPLSKRQEDLTPMIFELTLLGRKFHVSK